MPSRLEVLNTIYLTRVARITRGSNDVDVASIRPLDSIDLTNRVKGGNYRLIKAAVIDPERDKVFLGLANRTE